MALNKKVLVPLFFFFLFLGLTRFWDLGAKPYHHDESLYAVESWKYSIPHGDYQFNPMLHGPFLFHVQAALFRILPVNDYTGRLPVAFSGLLFPFLGIYLLRKKSAASIVTWFGLCTFSPIFCYFSRFLGMDLIMILLGTAFIASLSAWLEFRKERFLYSSFILFSFMVCTKLNFLFYIFSIISFLALLFFFTFEKDPKKAKEQLGQWLQVAKDNSPKILLAISISIFIFSALYSSLFNHPEGILDGLYRKMIPYWMEQHRIQRIKGPFHYYLPFLCIYEFPLLLAIALVLLRTVMSSKRLLRQFLYGVGFILLFWTIIHSQWNSLFPYFTKLHFDEDFHGPLAFFEVLLWWLLIQFHLERDEKQEAFFVHWAVVSLLIYSYAGEKIPWLLPHMLLPWFLYIASTLPPSLEILLQNRFKKNLFGLFLVLLISWQGVITIRASFPQAADPRERLVYTHTSTDILGLVKHIDHFSKLINEGKKLNLQVVGDSAWPLYWYLRDYNHWYWLNVEPEKSPNLFIVDWEKRELLPETFKERYTLERYKLREWWLYETNKATWNDYLKYYFTREPFSELGHQDIAVFVRNDRLRYWTEALTPNEH